MTGNMEHQALIISVLILIMQHPASTDVQTPDANLKEHVKKIDELLAEMQSHSKAQEQKNSAVLSSILSQLTKTTDELRDLKTSHNETILELEQKVEELSELRASHNATIALLELKMEENFAELSELRASHNATIAFLESTYFKMEEKDAEILKGQNATIVLLEEEHAGLSKLWTIHNITVSELNELRQGHNNVVVDMEKAESKLEYLNQRLSHNGNIGFHSTISNGRNFTANIPIIFDKIWYHSETVYNESTGKVIVPMNGTHQIWIDLKYRRSGGAVVFNIQRDNHTIDHAYGSSSDTTTSTVTISYLLKGQSIWISPSKFVYLDYSFCDFGIVLLNAH